MKYIQYRMRRNASTQGAVTKKEYMWNRGRVISAPPGEFSHLDSGHFEVIETATGVPDMETASVTPAVSNINASRQAIALALDNSIDLSTVTGTGAGGKITKADVMRLIE